eukprot:3661478-Rhodomonas_salina.1
MRNVRVEGFLCCSKTLQENPSLYPGTGTQWELDVPSWHSKRQLYRSAIQQQEFPPDYVPSMQYQCYHGIFSNELENVALIQLQLSASKCDTS